MKYEEFSGEYVKEVHYNHEPDSPFMILAMADGNSALGAATPDELCIGMNYVFYGRWKESSYGRQFAFSSFAEKTPTTEAAVISYLTRAPGIGRATARKFWKFYQQESIAAAKDPEVLRELGVQASRVQEAVDYLTNIEKHQETLLALTKLFGGHSLPRDLPRGCIRHWGARAPQMIEENPFILRRVFKGVGFKKCDAIWHELGKPLDSMLRARECVLYAVESARDGSVWYGRTQVYGETRAHIGTQALDPGSVIEEAVDKNLIAERPCEDRGHDRLEYATYDDADHERQLALRVLAIHSSADDSMGFVSRKSLAWPAVVPGLSPHQQEQLSVALSGPIGILTGGPGTGKTYTVAQLIKALGNRGSRGVAVSAPTGKAAVRSLEALREEGIVDVATKTMHSRLGWAGAGFTKSASDPLEAGVHILDEMSMVTNELLFRYLDACPRGSNVLLVLDPHQLPPVGVGKPALDLIKWGIPTGVLSEARRNSGKIVECCMEIRQRRRFVHSETLDLDTGDNLIMTGSKTPDGFLNDLQTWVGQALMMGYTHDQIQVLAPMNNRGPCSVKPLNKLLQKFCNPNEPYPGWEFAVDDKVICTQNGTYRLDGKGDAYCANGEQGVVQEIREKYCVVKMPYPDREVCFPKKGPLQLAWCITCHKSQGSEWPVTIVMFDPGASRMGTSELCTTAISRAKHFCVGIGERRVAQQWVSRTGLFQRRTRLKESLNDLRAACR